MRELNAASIKAPTGTPGDQWGTPMDLWEEIYERWFDERQFAHDPCPNPSRILTHTHPMADKLFRADGLDSNWPETWRVFINCPFSNIEPWVRKASKHTNRVVMLLPLRADQPWFHTYAPRARVVFIRGRVNYVDASAPTERKSGASFPSCLLIFGVEPGVEFWWPRSHQARGRRA